MIWGDPKCYKKSIKLPTLFYTFTFLPQAPQKLWVALPLIYKMLAFLCSALVGTLKAAKKRKIVQYKGEILLQGVHNDVDVILLVDDA